MTPSRSSSRIFSPSIVETENTGAIGSASLSVGAIVGVALGVGLGSTVGVEVAGLEQATVANSASRIAIVESVRIFTLKSLAELFDLLDDFFGFDLVCVVQSNALPYDLAVFVD